MQRGYLFEQGTSKQGQNAKIITLFWGAFSSKSEHRDPSKKTLFLGCPRNGPKAAFWCPRGLNGAQKGAFWMSFWHIFQKKSETLKNTNLNVWMFFSDVWIFFRRLNLDFDVWNRFQTFSVNVWNSFRHFEKVWKKIDFQTFLRHFTKKIKIFYKKN